MSPKVKVIVMITRLVEGEGSKRRKKADCYWPDRKVIVAILVIVLALVMMEILNMQNTNCYWPDRKVIVVFFVIMVLAMVFVMLVLIDMQNTWKCY